VESGSPREGLPTPALWPRIHRHGQRAEARSWPADGCRARGLRRWGGHPERHRSDREDGERNPDAHAVAGAGPGRGQADRRSVTAQARLAGWEESDTNQSEAADCEAISSLAMSAPPAPLRRSSAAARTPWRRAPSTSFPTTRRRRTNTQRSPPRARAPALAMISSSACRRPTRTSRSASRALA
jgi:hypothetical protein